MLKENNRIVCEVKRWLSIVVTKGWWSFFPVILTMVLGYFLFSKGGTVSSIKPTTETIAVVIMSFTVLSFCIATFIYRTKFNIVFLIVSIAFLCREIHFRGTSTGVYIVVGIAAVLAYMWQDEIFDYLQDKIQFKALIFSVVWSYSCALLIQRRVFKEGRVPLLPHEHNIHIILEELTEDCAHFMFLLLGIFAIIISKKYLKAMKFNDIQDTKTLDKSL